MTRSLLPSLLAAVALAFGLSVPARWLLLHLAGWQVRAPVLFAWAIPVIWIALMARMRVVLCAHHDRSATAFGSARWMGRRALRRMTRGTGLLIGRENRWRGRLPRYGGLAHLITIAPTRSGKGVGTIIPNLLAIDRSMLVIDPKGENAAITWGARSCLGPLHVLDPFGITGRPSAACNPLDRIDVDGPDAAEDAARLADALVRWPRRIGTKKPRPC
jgi:type IV secretion system protein VirD4